MGGIGSAGTSTPDTTTRVFLVDDHAVVRRGIRAILEAAGGFEVAGEAEDARSGLDGIISSHPDVALVDVRLSGGDGIEVIREVRSRCPDIPCVVLTSFPEATALYQAVLAGAAGFVIKDTASTMLIDRIRAAVRGDADLTLEDGARFHAHSGVEDVDRDLAAPLTPKERRVLDLMARGLTNAEIAEILDLAEKTIRNYVSNVLAKLSVRNRTEAAAMVARSKGRGPHRSVRTTARTDRRQSTSRRSSGRLLGS